MNIISVKDSLYSLRLFGINNINDFIDKILKHIHFDLAVKNDDYWTYLGDEPYPYSELDENEKDIYMKNNGILFKEKPVVWKFRDNEALEPIVFGFINADEVIIAKTGKKQEDFYFGIVNCDDDEKMIDFWGRNSSYFFSNLMDYSGFVFVSKKKETIEAIGKIVKSHFGNIGIRMLKGEKYI